MTLAFLIGPKHRGLLYWEITDQTYCVHTMQLGSENLVSAGSAMLANKKIENILESRKWVGVWWCQAVPERGLIFIYTTFTYTIYTHGPLSCMDATAD